MKVILLKDVAKVGRIGEIKEVSDGYAVNFLIPRKFAEKATAEKINTVENAMRGKLDRKLASESAMQKTLDLLSGKEITVQGKSNDKGVLYKEINAKEISEAIKSQLKMDVPETLIKTTIHLKHVGEFEVIVEAVGKSVILKLKIEST